MDWLGELYGNEIVRLHGIPLSIVSDRDPRFTSRFWKELKPAFGTRLNFSIAFHPQTNGQSARVIQMLEDMLQGCVLEFPRSWDIFLLWNLPITPVINQVFVWLFVCENID